MQFDEPVLVVGAGIAGLVAALSFSSAGFRVEVFERAASLDEAGAGIQLSPNALRVLGLLGLAGALRRDGVAAETVTLRSASGGRAIAEVPVLSGDGTAYLSIRRTDLQSALLDAVAGDDAIRLSLGCECVGVARDGNSGVVSFRTAGAPDFRRRARVVIAADGGRSAVARFLGHPDARPSGDVAWRMTLADAPAPRFRSEASGIEAWLGPARHAVAYPVRSGRETNIVLIGPESDLRAGRDGADAKASILRRFSGWDPRLLALIEAAGPASAWRLSTVDRRARPDDAPGILLVGDAAHAMLPYAAQGAAMAIEDGWVAACAFRAARTAGEAAARFEAERRPRLQRVRRRVAFHRIVYHLPFPLALGRDAALALRPRDALARDLAWLYDWVPPPMP